MADNNRMPSSQPEFNIQFAALVIWLKAIKSGETLSNGIRLGMTQAEIDTLSDYFDLWHSTDPAHPGIFDLHSNPETKTTVTTTNVTNLMAEVTDFMQPILVRMSGSAAITAGDRLVLHIAPPVEHHTQKTSPITTQTAVSSKPIGPGIVKISCTPIDSDTKGISEEADSIQIAICIVDPNYVEDPSLLGLVSKTAPESADHIAYREVHSKASDIYSFKLKYRGMKVHTYARQYMVAHPDLAGGWSELHIFFIP